MQGSSDTTYRLSHRTATTTRFSPEGIDSKKQTAPRFLPTSDQVGLHQMAPPGHTSERQACYSFIDPGREERLSWLSWLTCSGRFTHIVVTCLLQAEHRTGSVCRPKPVFCQLCYAAKRTLFISKTTARIFCDTVDTRQSIRVTLSCYN